MKDTHDKIAEKAYYNYLKKGSKDGDDLNDWLEAEKEIKKGKSTAKKPRKTIKPAATAKAKKK
jgi:hypothetical protein